MANWHNKGITNIYDELKTSPDGLSKIECKKRIKKNGHNNLPKPKEATIVEIFIQQFISPLIYLLLAAAAISLLIDEINNAIFIMTTLIINASLGCFQEWRAHKASSMLQKLLTTKTRVMRDGKEMIITSDQLVPGDIVFLESGNIIPADIRLTDANNLKIDESILTGESLATTKNIEIISEKTPLAEHFNMAYAGTNVTRGRATGIVVETGIKTQAGKIAQTVSTTHDSKTPLILRLEDVSKTIAGIVLICCGIIALIGLQRGFDLQNLFFLTAGLMVSAVPEGLPIAVTVTLAAGLNRMAKQNVIIRKLTAVEAFGSCNCIASDKTGTLTLNKQTVVKLILPSGEDFELTGIGYGESGNLLQGNKLQKNIPDQIYEMAKIGTLANEAHLENINDKVKFHGDDVDLAFKSFANKAGINESDLKKNCQVLNTIPFESEHRYSAAVFTERSELFIGVKGAVDTVLKQSTKIILNNAETQIDRTKIEQYSNSLAEKGYKVLAVAKANVKNQKDVLTNIDNIELCFLGLVGMIDPIRPDVKESINSAMQSGVTVIMVTGDHQLTALTIAKELGIATQASEVMTGQELENISNEDTSKIIEHVKNIKVFARVTPLQKLTIIKIRKAMGDFIAVTGDGVNDAPALKEAHLGIAMGSGSDIAKDTASAVISDDNFTSIVKGIKEGRLVYANIRKIIWLLISAGLAEILAILVPMILGLPMIFTAPQMLWLNLVTNGLQDISLAFEKGENNLLKKHYFKTGLFDSEMKSQLLISALFMAAVVIFAWWWLLELGFDQDYSRNLVFLLFVVLQNFHVLNCRSESASIFSLQSNYVVWASIFIAHFAQITAMYIPFMQEVLDLQPLETGYDWLAVFMVASSVLVFIEIYKFYKRIRQRFSQHKIIV